LHGEDLARIFHAFIGLLNRFFSCMKNPGYRIEAASPNRELRLRAGVAAWLDESGARPGVSRVCKLACVGVQRP
jgi:hypothetical protein